MEPEAAPTTLRLEGRSEANTNKSLGKAIRLLDCFTEERAEWSVSELSRHLGIGKSSVSTMLATLAQGGVVYQSPVTRRYQLGLRCLELGYLASSRLVLRDYAFPHLEALLVNRDYIVYMAIPYDYEVLYIEALYPPKRKTNYSSQGRRAPMHCTGIGKAALAFMPEEYVQGFLGRGELKRYTRNTITDPQELCEELERTRARGYALDRQEREEGIHCVAAPIKLSEGQLVASVSMSGAAAEMPEHDFPALALEVVAAARAISRKLISVGYTSSQPGRTAT